MSLQKKHQYRVSVVIVIAGFLICALLVGGGFWKYRIFIDSPLIELPIDSGTLWIEPGDSFIKMIDKLGGSSISEWQRLQWRLLAWQLDVEHHLQAGEYTISPGTSPRELLLQIRSGTVTQHPFTIIEGWNFRELRAALAKATPLQHDTVDLDDAALMKKLNYSDQHPEGRFLPETYLYVRGDNESDIFVRAHLAMDEALDIAWDSRSRDLPLQSKYKALVLASIIEKETGIADEHEQVAGVFLHRLKIGMLLQSDPTVIYGMGRAYTGNLRKIDLRTDSSYNTYTRSGLPPTPIAMPSVAALYAATHTTVTENLYFVAIGDDSGRHVFTPTLKDHVIAVRAYIQRNRTRRNSKKKRK